MKIVEQALKRFNSSGGRFRRVDGARERRPEHLQRGRLRRTAGTDNDPSASIFLTYLTLIIQNWKTTPLATATSYTHLHE